MVFQLSAKRLFDCTTCFEHGELGLAVLEMAQISGKFRSDQVCPRRQKLSELDVAGWLKVDDVCMRFEQQLRAGEKPRIETFLTDHPSPFRSHLLTSLLQLEFEYRIGTDSSLEIQEYIERFPEDQSLIQALHEEQESERLARRFKQKFRTGQTRDRNIPEETDRSRYKIQGEVARGGMGVMKLRLNSAPVMGW